MQLHIDVYIWCAFLVFVFAKLVSDVILQGKAKAATGIVSYPEDRKGSKKLASPDPANLSDMPLVRATNLFRNDLENIIPFSLIALAASFVQVDARLFVILLCLYALTRVSHAFCLIAGKQPFRSISYLLGQACTLVLVIPPRCSTDPYLSELSAVKIPLPVHSKINS